MKLVIIITLFSGHFFFKYWYLELFGKNRNLTLLEQNIGLLTSRFSYSVELHPDTR